jgi:hypothetical protein
MTHVATSGYALFAIEVPGEDPTVEPRLLMRGNDDPFTFTTRDSAATIAATCGMPGAVVVGLSVTGRWTSTGRSAPERTPWQADRDRTERTGLWPESWGPFHRHFASDAIHRDGGHECDQPGTPRRVYVFDPDALREHEAHVARYAIAHPGEFEEPCDSRPGS